VNSSEVLVDASRQEGYENSSESYRIRPEDNPGAITSSEQNHLHLLSDAATYEYMYDAQVASTATTTTASTSLRSTNTSRSTQSRLVPFTGSQQTSITDGSMFANFEMPFDGEITDYMHGYIHLNFADWQV
jgi:hypothetical protein